MARPELTFDDKDNRLVAVMTRYGIPPLDIAAELDIDVKTLKKHFGDVIETAKVQLKFEAATAMFRKARKGSVAAMIYLSKQMDRPQLEQPPA